MYILSKTILLLTVACIMLIDSNLCSTIRQRVTTASPDDSNVDDQDPDTTAMVDRQADLSTLIPSVLGLLATGKMASLLLPLIVKFIVLPFAAVLKVIGKTLLLLGVMAYLVSAFIPALVGYVGLAAPFMARSSGDSIFTSFSNSFAHMANRAFAYLNMDSVECKEMVSCRSGEYLAEQYPQLVKFIKTSNVEKWVSDKYATNIIQAIQGRVNCSRDFIKCSGLDSAEKFVYRLDETQPHRPMTLLPVLTTMLPMLSTTPAPQYPGVLDLVNKFFQ